MKIIVQKYGGSSVATIEKLRSVARRVVETKQHGHAVVVVVSAMGNSTNELVDLARQLSSDPSRRELDALLVTGEMVSMSLLAIAIQESGEDAIALNGLQCGILTNDVHSNAQILEVRPARIRKHLERGEIVVVAGFQGFTSSGDLTTLGRGGSDTTAVALAAALEAEHCEIYTDVAGVFTADPRVVPQARFLKELGAAEMQELAWTGAKVLKAGAVELARASGVSMVVRSTFEDGHDTWVHPHPKSEQTFRPSCTGVAGVSGRKDVIRITLGLAECAHASREAVFDLIAKYDLIFGETGNFSEPADILISSLEIPAPAAFARRLRDQFGDDITVADRLGMVSLVGFGLGSRPASFLDASGILRQAQVPVVKSFTTRESLCFVVPVSRVNASVALMHEAFIKESCGPPRHRGQQICDQAAT
ncbi:MAG: aspartate kinase [Pseudomonas sp.]